MLQSKAGYIDARPHIRQLDEVLLQRTAGPYICGQLVIEKIDTRQVTSWPGEAGDKAKPDRGFAYDEDGGDGRGGRLGRDRSRKAMERGNNRNLATD